MAEGRGGGSNAQGAAELERAAAGFLRKRGFVVIDPDWVASSNASGAQAGRLTGSVVAFGRLTDWVEASAATVRAELLVAIAPIFLHLFFALVEQDEVPKAQGLLMTRREVLERSLRRQVVEQLRAVSSMSDLRSLQVYAQFRREERTVVVLSAVTRDILLSRLLSPEMAVFADIFQRRVKVVPPHEAETSVPLPELVDAEVRVVNASHISCAVDPLSPPSAYGVGWVPPSKSSAGGWSADNIGSSGIPIPKGDSAARATASRHFAALASRREALGAERWPSVAAYCVERSSDNPIDINSMAVSSDGRHCAAAADRGVKLWDLGPNLGQEGGENKSKAARQTPASCSGCSSIGSWTRTLDVAFSSAGQFLLSAGQDGEVRLWNVLGRSGLGIFSWRSDPVWAVDWGPVDHYFVSGGSDGEALLWSVERSHPLRILRPLKTLLTNCSGPMRAEVEVVKTHPSNQFAAVASSETLVLWNLATASPARVFATKPESTATSLAFSPDGKLLAAGCADGRLQLWDMVASKLWLDIPGAHTGPVLALDFSCPSAEGQGGPLLFSGGLDGRVQLRHVTDMQQMATESSDSSFPSRCPPPPLATFAASGVAPNCREPVQVRGGRFTLANLLLVTGVSGHLH